MVYSMAHEFIPTQVELDLDATAGTKYTWKPAGEYHVYKVTARFTEAVAAGGFSTTTPVVSCDLTLSGSSSPTEVMTLSPDTTNGQAVGTEKEGTMSSGPFSLKSGDQLEFKIKTAGAGGTVTGKCVLVFFADRTG